MSLRARAILALVALSGILASCSDMKVPSQVENHAAPTLPTTLYPPFPTPTSAATVYLSPDSLFADGVWVHGSRYVLFDDGAFSYQSRRMLGIDEITGRWTRAGSVFDLDPDTQFSGWWCATATLLGDDLVVKYCGWMFLDGWVDETYLGQQ